MVKLKIGRLMAAIIICQLAGIIGSVFTLQSIPSWYATLVKPSFAPPNWLFGPVWITLYTLMGISLYLVWDKGFKKKENKIALYIFAAQLALNAMWSVVFFGLKSTFYGLMTIVVLWIAIAATIISFYKISKKAAWLLVPYITWVSIATVLNFYIWQLNFG
ncbi:MAG: tryptophan-rich sensory protein [Candidatus Aenigmarchaeota archaeon]|nr:tryptophan-rich sensory protein [Candidatus Aenigmarchaeota archaeon]